jgi:hypothetical protein
LALPIACISGAGAKPYPLYSSDAPLPEDQVAVLYGDIDAVDGRDVRGLGKSFALLPGCHVVRSATRWGEGGQTGAVVASLPPLSFAIDMEAGKRYVVEIRMIGVGSHVMVGVEARELDAQGETIRGLAPTEDAAELAQCQDWAPD